MWIEYGNGDKRGADQKAEQRRNENTFPEPIPRKLVISFRQASQLHPARNLNKKVPNPEDNGHVLDRSEEQKDPKDGHGFGKSDSRQLILDGFQRLAGPAA
jgi:hypothetical protein